MAAIGSIPVRKYGEIVPLTTGEHMVAWHVASMRRTNNTYRGYKDAHGAESSQNADEIELMGVKSEMAVAKWLGVFWDVVINDTKTADVGDVQVRSIKDPNRQLILHKPDETNGKKKDLPDQRCMLVLVGETACKMLGWVRIGNFQKKEYWNTTLLHDPAYLIPQRYLNPISTWDDDLENIIRLRA